MFGEGSHNLDLGLNRSQEEWVAGILLTLLTEARRLKEQLEDGKVDGSLLSEDFIVEVHAQAHEFLLQSLCGYTGKISKTSSFPGCRPIAIAALTFLNSENEFIAGQRLCTMGQRKGRQ